MGYITLENVYGANGTTYLLCTRNEKLFDCQEGKDGIETVERDVSAENIPRESRKHG